MRIKTIIAVLVLALLATAAYALNPSINISASPSSNVGSTVVISSTAFDPDTSGLYNLSIYEDGSISKSLLCGGSQTCVISNTFVHGASNHTYHAVVVDATGNIISSNTIPVTFAGVNIPPNFTSPLPNETVLEDSGMNFNLTDLWNFAEDYPSNDSQLTFTITSQSNLSLMACSINSSRYLQCNVTAPNMTGTSTINFSVTDQPVGLSPAFVNTSTQLITVLEVNDPPMLTNLTLANITVQEDSSNTSVNLSNFFYDIDNPTLTYTLISTNPDVTASIYNNTMLNVTSKNNNTNSSNLTIKASDGNLSVNFTTLVVVINVNDPPFFNPQLVNQEVNVSNLLTYDINASDVDIPTVFTFFANSSLFAINSATGLINFTPTAAANETVLVTVCDDSNAPNNCTNSTFTLTVIDNLPPVS